MNNPSELELRYARIAAEGAALFGDDPRSIRAHIEARLRDWTDDERRELRHALALKAAGPGASLATDDGDASNSGT